ncbi:MAG TPA: thioredoxin family protein [Alcaligenaceae bacterium]|nr:thioredoxin family protein [Alcaligenaceae bacterium]
MLYPQKDQKELQQKLSSLSDNEYIVVCFCAAWCRTCQGFEAQIESLEKKYPYHCFVWVDVEEHEELLIDEDIEDFPTILIQNKKGTLFYGPLLPFAEHIDRLLQQAEKNPQFVAPVASFEQLVTAAAK